jgi:hypothetical protein
MKRAALILLFVGRLSAQQDLWDQSPLRYSETPARDRLAELALQWQLDDGILRGGTLLERVWQVLAALKVPEASQVLVFSKTSKQNGIINPGNPRALFHSLNCYCAFVPGGLMEVIIQEKTLGPVFYIVDLGYAGKAATIERDTSDCLSCHGSGRTENVPGMLVRSVFPDQEGHALLSFGSGLVTHETPVAERWGGYYVTGSIALPHLGNRTYVDGRSELPQAFAWPDLRGKIDVRNYPCATSDIVSLMVLEHQCQAHNLLTAATMNYKRTYYLSKAIDPNADPDSGSAGRVADQSARKIVEWFLFKGEASIGVDGVQGDEKFQKQFAALLPRTRQGESLADFQLNSRLFKNRSSYMIYSEAFVGLPEAVKSRVIQGLKKILEADGIDDEYPNMKLSERRRTAKILDDTGIW